MNYYTLDVKFNRRDGVFWSTDDMLPFPDKKEENVKAFYRNLCQGVNEELSMSSRLKTKTYAYYAREGIVKFICEADMTGGGDEKIKEEIRKVFRDKYDQVDISFSKSREIIGKSYYQMGNNARRQGYIDDFDDDEIDVFRNDNHPFKLKEDLLPGIKYSKEKVLEMAEESLANETFIHEIERIYSDKNEKKYYGNPVHYMLTVTNRDSIDDMINILGIALTSNNRLLGRRITRVGEVEEHCYDEDDFEQTIARSAGNIVLFEMEGSYEDHGNYASAYHRVIEYIGKLFKKYQRKTLFVFVKNAERPGFSGVLTELITESARIVEIKEGGGDREQVIGYIKSLAQRDGQPIEDKEVRQAVSNKKYFKVGEVHEIYNKCFSNALMINAYQAYKTCDYLQIEGKKKNTAPYEELQKMIGLTEVKSIIDSIINNARIQKIRSKKGMDSFKTSLHMVYTGNPGSAKTTVARLLAQILAKEEIIESGVLVECGRGDLVGKYVGWTAREVQAKFRDAQGGILFIDEAYSLLEHWEGSYGDEAINTIVQEMENHRDDVIVIFAGYPDKMKEFLDRNEGLRSRIAFHVDFPDYNPKELGQILKLMADEKGLSLGTGVDEKCEEIFMGAVSHKDYGNGRFVRNLLEQAILAQSNRLSNTYNSKNISRKALMSLVPEDFEVNASKQYAQDKMRIGF